MSNQIVISSGAKVRNLDGVLTGTSGIVNSVPLGAANGVATLDSGGKVPVSQLPSSVVTYLGTWNAATNTPTLVNGTGDAGDMYICNVAGTVNFGAGPVTFAVGDWVLYGSGTWQKSNGQNGTVTSVAVTESGDALTITGSPITTAGTINIGFAGTSGQYVNGAGGLTTFPSLAGYVTSVTATAPLLSSGGTTPDLSIPAASASVDGYLDNADWTTFNNKQNAITLTTTGTSGVSTLVGSTLNIPNYSTDLSGYVPYTGATANVNLGTFDLTADVITGSTGSFASSGGSNTFAINHSSGSGIALNITKGGNGEGLYINKTSGSGNAATIIGTLNATTLVKSGGTSSQFLKADGSVDASAYITLTSLSAGTGISYNNTTGVITNSAPDQTVSLTAGAGISISGTYPSFTIASTITQYTDALARAALSFTAGSGAYNSTTGVITIPTNNNQITNGAGYITSSALSDYLPLSGGTLTGGLNGTTATFSGLGTFYQLTMTGATAGRLFYAQTGGVFSQSGNLVWNNTTEQLGVGTPNPSAVVTAFSTNAATQLKAAGTAPAITFSNTLTSASLACVFGLATANNHFVTGTAPGDMAIANQSTSPGAIVFGTGTFEKMRMTSAGDLAVGDSSASANLWVKNSGAGNTFGARNTNASFGATIGFFGADRNTSNNSFYYIDCYNYGSGTYRFRVADSGAVTSASSITADGNLTLTNNRSVILSNPGTAAGSLVFYNATTATVRSGIGSFYNIADQGNLEFLTGGTTTRMVITSGGNVAIAMTSPIYSERLSVRQSSSANLTGFSIGYSSSVNEFRSMSIVSSNAMTFNNGVNEATLTAAGAWTNASDLRLKKDIKDIKYGLDTILNSKPRSYNRIDVEGEYIGFIAQELLDIIPEVVSGNIDTQYCVDYGSLVAVAFKAIQEQQAQIEELKELIKNK